MSRSSWAAIKASARISAGTSVAGGRRAGECQQRSGDALQRQDLIDRHMLDGAARHLLERGITRVLDHRQAATAPDRLQSRRAVIQKAGQ
jgi:hypothetical protein